MADNSKIECADYTAKLLAAAESCTAAALDMIAAAREGGQIFHHDSIGSGDTTTQLVDGLRLLMDCLPEQDEGETQLYGAIVRFLGDRDG